MGMKEVAEKYSDYQVEMRRWFHNNAEVSEKEYETAKKIREELDKMGVEWEHCGLETSTLATIKGAKPGKTVLLRGDIDALSVTEETGLPFASKTKGVMHACGHDCHISMLLTAAHILNDMKDELCGTVKLAWQSSEEVATGAKAMVEDGALDGVDACFAMHVWGNVPAGHISCDAGPRMGAARKFEIDVQGNSGHGAQPDLAVDAIVAGSAIVGSLQTVVSRKLAPAEPAVVTVGTFNAGERWNVIAGSAKLTGTTRCFSYDVFNKFPEYVEQVATDTAKAYGCTAEVRDTLLVPPTVNDEGMSALARAVAQDVIGEEAPIHVPPTAGGEDFAYFMEKVPGCVLLLGVADEASGACYVQHHSKFTVYEPELIRGAQIYAKVAMDFNAGREV